MSVFWSYNSCSPNKLLIYSWIFFNIYLFSPVKRAISPNPSPAWSYFAISNYGKFSLAFFMFWSSYWGELQNSLSQKLKLLFLLRECFLFLKIYWNLNNNMHYLVIVLLWWSRRLLWIIFNIFCFLLTHFLYFTHLYFLLLFDIRIFHLLGCLFNFFEVLIWH